MEVITIQSQAFQEILNKLDSITKTLHIKEGKSIGKISDKWLTLGQTCEALNISRRTCQAYRDEGILSFSQHAGKIYFKMSDIEAHLEKHYKPAFRKI